ncbi:MAG: cytochrome c peroxidase [Pseudomonadota bacterium]
MHTPHALRCATLLLAVGLVGCQDTTLRTPEPLAVLSTENHSVNADNQQGFVPISSVGVDPDDPRIQLGKLLFHDTRLSHDRSISCASCHQVARGGADARPVSIGVNDVRGRRNAPSVLNSVHNFRQFWDGRASDLKAQATGPITNPAEMASDWSVVIERLQADGALSTRFRDAGYEAVDRDAVTDAIAAYESALITPAPFDRWLLGDLDALDGEALRGSQRFVDLGCVSCHQGKNVGGNMFQKFGVVGDYYADHGGGTDADLGRFNVTQRPQDKHVFKVPSLRNVMETAPYFHDGSVERIEDAIRIMARYQLGRELDDEDVQLLKAFLGALSAKPKAGLL